MKCGEKIELNEDKDKATADGRGATGPAARTSASSQAQQRAVGDAYEAMQDHECPDGCPVRRMDLEISKPKVDKPDPLPAGGFMAHAECKWRCKLSCWEHVQQLGRVELENQDLLCSDGWTLISEMDVQGDSVTGKPPTNPLEEGELMIKVLKLLPRHFAEHLRDAVDSFKCPPSRCPTKRLRLILWPPERVEAGPDPNGNYTWHAKQRCRVEVRCTD